MKRSMFLRGLQYNYHLVNRHLNQQSRTFKGVPPFETLRVKSVIKFLLRETRASEPSRQTSAVFFF
jgi:hypothetical protein